MKIRQTPYYLLALITLSVIGATAVLFSTRWGIGLSPDSVVYIGAARNLLSGNGLSVPSYSGEFTPMTQYPPLFSIWLAGIGYIGIDPMDGARWLNALLFAANITLVGLVVYASTRSLLPSIFGSLLMMGSLPAVQIHSMAWSEPLFIFFGILGLFLLALYMEKPRYVILAVSSMAVALAFLARYAGIALVATGVIAILLLSKYPWRKRLFDVGVFCTISCVPMILWIIRNLVVAGTATNREVAFHPLTTEHLRAAVDTISTWLLPVRVPPSTRWVSLLIVVTMVILIFVLSKREMRRDERKNPEGPTGLPALLGFFILNYGLLLLVSISFFDVHTPVDNRILSPVYVATLTLVLCLSPNLSTTLIQGRSIRIALIIFCVVFSVSHLLGVIPWLTHSYSNGIGYASRAWKQSALIEHINGLDSKVPIFTNGPDAVYILTGRPAYMIPSKVDPGTRLVNSNYPYDLATMRKELEMGKGVLVYFNKISWRWYLPSEKELKKHLKLHLHATEEDGSIYQVERKGNSAVGR